MSMGWHELGPNFAQIDVLKDFISSNGWDFPSKLSAIRGGGVLKIQDGILSAEDQTYLSQRNRQAVIPISTGGKETDRLIFFPTEKTDSPFSANFTAYRSEFSRFLSERWDEEKEGIFPLPEVTDSRRLDDGRYINVTRYRPGLQGLGLGGPEAGVNRMDIGKLTPENLKQLVRVLDRMHVRTSEYMDWLNKENIILPDESWLHPRNPKRFLRGQEWWEERKKELGKWITDNKEIYQAIDGEFDFNKSLVEMIDNNKSLYPHVDGRIEDSSLVCETVVAHGTLYADQIHYTRDKDGRINFTVTGGDRAHYGLRGEMIDWLVTAAASSPKHQLAMIEEFNRLHPDLKERRALAMHLMYRSIGAVGWYSRNNKPDEAKRLARLVHDILETKGEGEWWKNLDQPL